MITLFTTPKPFQSHWAILQQNAVGSWRAAMPECEVLLFGDEEGSADAAARNGARHLPEIPVNEHGTPLVNELFRAAMREAQNDVLCYINADIILRPDFADAVRRIRRRPFLMVGATWGIDWHDPIDFENEGWLERLSRHTRGNSKRRIGMDYFVFTRETWREIPPFAIGRGVWDQWLIFGAISNRVSTIDASDATQPIHQNHDWSAHPGGKDWIWNGPEIKRNRELAGNYGLTYSCLDATHRLTRFGVAPIVTRRRISRAVERFAERRPQFKQVSRAFTALLHPRAVRANAG